MGLQQPISARFRFDFFARLESNWRVDMTVCVLIAGKL